MDIARLNGVSQEEALALTLNTGAATPCGTKASNRGFLPLLSPPAPRNDESESPKEREGTTRSTAR